MATGVMGDSPAPGHDPGPLGAYEATLPLGSQSPITGFRLGPGSSCLSWKAVNRNSSFSSGADMFEISHLNYRMSMWHILSFV